MPSPIWIPPELRHRNLEEYKSTKEEQQRLRLLYKPSPEELKAAEEDDYTDMPKQPETAAERSQRRKELLEKMTERGGEDLLSKLTEEKTAEKKPSPRKGTEPNAKFGKDFKKRKQEK